MTAELLLHVRLIKADPQPDRRPTVFVRGRQRVPDDHKRWAHPVPGCVWSGCPQGQEQGLPVQRPRHRALGRSAGFCTVTTTPLSMVLPRPAV